MLLLFAPGAAARERYFEEMAEMMERGGEELQKFREFHDGYYPAP